MSPYILVTICPPLSPSMLVGSNISVCSMTHQQRLAVLTLLVAAAAGSVYPAWPAPATTHPYSVTCHAATKCSLSPGRSAAATGWGTFSNQINSTGWSVLDVHTNPASSGADQAFAAGFLEGALTAELITVHAGNVWSLNFNSSTPFPEVTVRPIWGCIAHCSPLLCSIYSVLPHPSTTDCR